MTYASRVRRRRQILGLSQRDLERRSGVRQPLIAAIETGARTPSPATREALDAALETKPSTALKALHDEVVARFAEVGLPAPVVFGSVARHEDDARSDIDLMVAFTDDYDIVDLLALEEDLTELLTFPVDVIDARADSRVAEQARREAVPL
ncbi:XRE family transcriptional regulator [Myceligenerans pegani]|uniref:XRE family transcriptional regulator n=1 Tax=Myceligenerans pegani TaxID=2776917 RepID=A0ABR9N2F7_9MICO|nr:XRE family transcriptional regulator [Myceligenerans sp. TRM 65318]MBE1877831.1 XRE family transcriptional regulator [Myceligenerans sp. TRM 65318]MBE3020102.1 XRE family transcriptional regulator [Myceligenerans sp. TRM 65318]